MERKLHILFIVSESAPYAKSGGLADVAASLPKALADRGHQLTVVMPYYSSIPTELLLTDENSFPMKVRMGDREEQCSVQPKVINKNLSYYFIKQDNFFSREGFYHDNAMQDYGDNPKRFGFLSQAALQLCKLKKFYIDIVHAHDWQSAPAMAYLKTQYRNCPSLGKAAGLLTIHNLGYQGKYSSEFYSYLGFRAEDFIPQIFEDYGGINLLKGGIHYADIVNTVSPSYANETLNPAYSHGLHPFLSVKGDRYVGILNGVDYTEWDPSEDPLIAAQYSLKDMSGKAVCKQALQQRMGLHQQVYIPMIGMVSRMAEQKGYYQLRECIEDIVNNMHVQFAILGSGDKELEHYFGNLPQKYPGFIAAHIGYDNSLAHQIEAGSDFFLMPSLYEPCGLNQIYSLRYGTLPIVRATGGLDDTVDQYVESNGGGTGFKYHDATPTAIYNTVGWAVSTYYDRREHFNMMRRRAMRQDFSWEESAIRYENAYQRASEIANSGK